MVDLRNKPTWIARLAIAASCWVLWTASPSAAQYVDTTTSCLLCHRTALPQNDFCQLVPAAIWEQSDKHNRSFTLWHDTEPQRELVRRILGFDLREAFVDDRYTRLKSEPDAETTRRVATVKACLRCHATWPIEADEKFPLTPPVPLALGVSCQACHGPGESWETSHRLAAWRLVTPAAKAALGCADVRTTVAKARLCASCHVGDWSQGRFVKHEWYAAGHPPLPSFELASFESQMPVHWKSLRAKGAFALRDGRPGDDNGQLATQLAALERAGVPAQAIRESYRAANFPDANSKFDPCDNFSQTKDAIVAGAVVLETYVRLLGDYAAQATKNEAAWPELSLYDCTACHHELRSGGGIQSRPGRRHAPGRPPLATWPLVLAQLSAAQAADYDPARSAARWSAVRTHLAALEQAATARPFGDPAAIEEASRPLAASLRELATAAAATRFDATSAARSLRFLLEPANYETHDYSTDLFFRESSDILALKLPSGPGRSVLENLHHWLPAAARYDPVWFRSELDGLRNNPQWIPPQKP
jgi:Cytochrome c554 and c-prime